MSLLHLLHMVRKHEEDRGVGLIWQCPHCRGLGRFSIIERSTTLRVFFISSPGLFSLRCSECRYELNVSRAEIQAVQKIQKLTAQMMGQQLSAEDYHKMVIATDALFVRSLLARAEVWKCPKCPEENPTNFLSCWGCGTQKDPSQVPTEAPSSLSKVATGGGNPWEQ